MKRRFDRVTFAIRHKSGDYVSSISNGRITHLPDMLHATEYASFESAENVMREFTKADEYTFVRIHVRAVSELDGKTFAFNPRLKDVKVLEKQYNVTTQIIIKEVEKQVRIERFWNRMIFVGLYIVTPACALIPLVVYLFQMAKKWWM